MIRSSRTCQWQIVSRACVQANPTDLLVVAAGIYRSFSVAGARRDKGTLRLGQNGRRSKAAGERASEWTPLPLATQKSFRPLLVRYALAHTHVSMCAKPRLDFDRVHGRENTGAQCSIYTLHRDSVATTRKRAKDPDQRYQLLLQPVLMPRISTGCKSS